MLELIESTENIALSKINNLANLNQSILAQAFRGELVEQDPNDEPAAVLLDRIRAEREVARARRARGGSTWGRSSKLD